MVIFKIYFHDLGVSFYTLDFSLAGIVFSLLIWNMKPARNN